jgi:uncharacterized phiE125 gp8 family phage protein
VSLTRVTGPAAEPLDLAEAKLHLRVEEDFTDDDGLINSLIQAAREHVESAINRGLLQQSWRLTLDCFPYDDTIDLGMPDVSAVTAFNYVDTSGVSTPFSAYTLDADAFPARIIRNYGTTWPSARVQKNAVTITFTVGQAGRRRRAGRDQGGHEARHRSLV